MTFGLLITSPDNPFVRDYPIELWAAVRTSRRALVSETTIKTYVSRLLTKLDITNRTQAAILGHEAGLFDL